MQKIYMSELDSGDIVMLKHTNDHEKNSYHPFLILYVSQKRVLALQFSSMDTQGKSYFGDLNYLESINFNVYHNDIIETNKIVLSNTKLKYVSVADPTFLYSFYIEYNKKVKWIDSLSNNKFNSIINQIPKDGWSKEIQDLVNNFF